MLTRRDMFKGLLGAGAGVALGKAALGEESPLPGPNIKKLVLDAPVKVAPVMPEQFVGYNQPATKFDISNVTSTVIDVDMDTLSSDNMLWMKSNGTEIKFDDIINDANLSADEHLNIVVDGNIVARFTKDGLEVI